MKILFAGLFILLISCDKDLGVLYYERPTSNNAYCVYKIEEVISQPDKVGYKVGDTICIKCRYKNKNPWPDGPGNSCPSPITFETPDKAEYKAKLNIKNGSCIACPISVKNGYDTPKTKK